MKRNPKISGWESRIQIMNSPVHRGAETSYASSPRSEFRFSKPIGRYPVSRPVTHSATEKMTILKTEFLFLGLDFLTKSKKRDKSILKVNIVYVIFPYRSTKGGLYEKDFASFLFGHVLVFVSLM